MTFTNRLETILEQILNEDNVLAFRKMLRSQATDEQIENLIEADPTKQKNYLKWIGTQYLKGDLKPETAENINKQLTFLYQNKEKAKQLSLDINLQNKTIEYLTYIIDAIKKSQALKKGTQETKYPGVQTAYKDENYTIYISPQTNDKKSTIISLMNLGRGTKWCTRPDFPNSSLEDEEIVYEEDGRANWPQTNFNNYEASKAAEYLAEADIFVIYKNGLPFLQLDFETCQCMDVYDKETTLEKSNVPKSVVDVITQQFLEIYDLQTMADLAADGIFGTKYFNEFVKPLMPETKNNKDNKQEQHIQITDITIENKEGEEIEIIDAYDNDEITVRVNNNIYDTDSIVGQNKIEQVLDAILKHVLGNSYTGNTNDYNFNNGFIIQ